MPSGSIHDRITLWSLPLVTAVTLSLTRSSDLTLIVSGGFLFSGLMFSPDLDLSSRPFKRWGWLRWIWIPYQKAIRHRSVFSHGFIIGTTVRVLYLTGWMIAVGGVGVLVIQLFQDVPWSWPVFGEHMRRSLYHYRSEWMGAFIGLELGAMSHIISDWITSTYKRVQRRTNKPKRKPVTRKRKSSR